MTKENVSKPTGGFPPIYMCKNQPKLQTSKKDIKDSSTEEKIEEVFKKTLEINPKLLVSIKDLMKDKKDVTPFI